MGQNGSLDLAFSIAPEGEPHTNHVVNVALLVSADPFLCGY